MRGRANIDAHDADSPQAQTQAITLVMLDWRTRPPRIVIRKDTRLSGYMLETALAASICAMGRARAHFGRFPPTVANLTPTCAPTWGRDQREPFADNGIKIFLTRTASSYPTPKKQRSNDSWRIRSSTRRITPGRASVARSVDDAIGQAVVYAKGTFKVKTGWHPVVMDATSGRVPRRAAACRSSAQVTTLGCRPSRNINRDCGALHPEHVIARREASGVRPSASRSASDADRVIIVDGAEIDGDAVTPTSARPCASQTATRQGTLVTTVA